MKKFLTAAVFLLVCGASLVMAADDPGLTRAEFERLAAEMPYLSLETALYQRTYELVGEADPESTKTHFRILTRLEADTDPKEELLALLVHPDSKVRTLAAVALFERQDPSVLPALAALADDGAATFDGHGKISEAWLHRSGIGPPQKLQTVGFVAGKMVDFYLQAANYRYGLKPADEPGFAEYWTAHKDRAFCASWLAVSFDQATGGVTPTQPDHLERVAAVRRRIDALPADERAWVLLLLHEKSRMSRGDDLSDALATEDELVEAARGLGAEKLLLMLRDKIPTDDPDLQPIRASWSQEEMKRFVLRHASALLRPEHSADLLADERVAHYPTAWWAAAAARLDPPRAASILRDALKRFGDDRFHQFTQDRPILWATMWQVGGPSETGEVLDDFYGENPASSNIPNGRSAFIGTVGEGPRARTMLAAVVRDPRFETLDWERSKNLRGSSTVGRRCRSSPKTNCGKRGIPSGKVNTRERRRRRRGSIRRKPPRWKLV